LGTALQAPVLESQVPVLQASSSPLQLMAVPGLHVRLAKSHVSTPLHASASTQSASLVQAHLLLSALQPPGSTQLSTVHAILSSHTMAVPPHTPLVHLSPLVQALLSPQAVLSGLFGFEQTPVAASHVPASWHWSLAEHVTGLAPVQTPVTHVSVLVHRLPSLQAVPSFLTGLLQAPVEVLQVPAVWHWSLAAHVTGLAPVQAPVWQVSTCVQALPSLQAEPSFLAGLLHVPVAASQVPTA
jgi:hypothetical protein